MGFFLRRLRRLVGAAAVVFGLVGCEAPSEPVICTTIAVQAITLTVVDGVSGQRVCDATVTAVDGSFSQVLPPFPGSAPDCTYSGPTERAGTYEVRVSRAGYQPAIERNVRVTADQCHVMPVRLTVTLNRTRQAP